MKRQRTKQKTRNRETGYYWVKIKRPNGTEQWIIQKWWKSYKFWDMMVTIPEMGKRDKIIEVDENQIIKEEKVQIKRRRLK